MATGPSTAQPASRMLVVICAVATWFASAAWTEFRDMQARQNTERSATISQFQDLGVKFNSTALKFNVKSARSMMPDEESRTIMIENIGQQDALIGRIEVYLNASEKADAEAYRDQLVEFRKSLLQVHDLDSMNPYLERLGLLVDHRESIDARLASLKTAYVLPFTTMRVGGTDATNR